MDIAKYIGLFLEKNRYCYLPNLGEFNVTKRPAKYQDGQMMAPEFDVAFKFSGGLIDDAFANFVANNERISIASAANAIRDFSVATRQTLSEGGSVVIPGFGKLVSNGEKYDFVADPNIQVQPQGIPVFKINTAATRSTVGAETIAEIHEKMTLKEPKSEEEIVIKPPSVNWTKIIILLLIVLAVISGIGQIIYYFNSGDKEVVIEATAPAANEQEQAVATTSGDTLAAAMTSADSLSGINPNIASSQAPAAQSGIAYGIFTYAERATAEKKEKKLKGFGHNVAIREVGGAFVITIVPPHIITDTANAKDSLRRFFNPTGTVQIFK
jgi:nucleoid DNA-binding protein